MLFAPAFSSTVTRDQVKAEYFQAAKTHQIVAAHHPVIGTI